jgi:hypothetical protein
MKVGWIAAVFKACYESGCELMGILAPKEAIRLVAHFVLMR